LSRPTGGLSPNIRLPGAEAPEPVNDDVVVELAAPAGDQPQVNEGGDVISIEHDDGSVTISWTMSRLSGPAPTSTPAGSPTWSTRSTTTSSAGSPKT
jgi:hypothetical protein